MDLLCFFVSLLLCFFARIVLFFHAKNEKGNKSQSSYGLTSYFLCENHIIFSRKEWQDKQVAKLYVALRLCFFVSLRELMLYFLCENLLFAKSYIDTPFRTFTIKNWSLQILISMPDYLMALKHPTTTQLLRFRNR